MKNKNFLTNEELDELNLFLRHYGNVQFFADSVPCSRATINNWRKKGQVPRFAWENLQAVLASPAKKDQEEKTKQNLRDLLKLADELKHKIEELLRKFS